MPDGTNKFGASSSRRPNKDPKKQPTTGYVKFVNSLHSVVSLLNFALQTEAYSGPNHLWGSRRRDVAYTTRRKNQTDARPSYCNTAQAAAKQSINIAAGTSLSVQATRLPIPQNKVRNFQENESEKQSTADPSLSTVGCWYCGAEVRHPRSNCPATGKECIY